MKTLHLFFLALLAGCVTPAAAPAPTLVPLPDSPPAKVVMISYDGLGADALERHIAAGHLTSGGYDAIRSNGTTARVLTVEPSLTAPAHISLVTGADPQVTGIVSNMFHLPGAAIGASATAYAADISAETLWEAARRQGKRAGVLVWPGADARTAARGGDFGLIWTDSITRSRITTLDRSDFEAEWLPPGWRGTPDPDSFSPVLTARVPWTMTHEGATATRNLVFVARDSTNDGVTNYDRIIVREDRTPLPTDGKWFAVSADVQRDGTTQRYGSWSRVIRFDPDLKETVIYWGPIARVEGYPESYRRMIETEVGFWPSAPDGWSVGEWFEGRNGLTPEMWGEQMVRFSSFFTRATQLTIAKIPFDLLLAYNPTIDETEHQFLLVNDRQRYSTPANRERAAGIRQLAFAKLDQTLAELRGSIDFQSTALVVVSDHGLSPLDSRIALNKVLVAEGFATQTGDALDPSSRWAAFTSGHMAHLYRFGETNEAETARLVKVLTDLRAPDGEPAFDLVETKKPQHHPNSGDVVAFTNPRFALSSSLRGELFEQTNYFGQHGGLNRHTEFHAVFAAEGAGVARGLQIPAVEQTDIARYVSLLLGIEPPKQAR